MDERKMRNRLLLVDGDPTSLRVLDVSLRSAGFDVETATNGSEAWALLEGAVPDLIIADTELAGIDGFELCTRVRRNPLGASIPFIFLAADKTLEHKLRSLAAGASDYLVKPAYIKEVLARVRALLQRRDRDRLTSDPSASTGSDRFTGDLGDITVVDLVQVMEGNGRSGMAHLRGPGGATAAIYFRLGKVVDAEVGRISGIDALSRLFSWTAGTFDLEWKSIRRKDAIERSTRELVIEGMRRLDEWNRLSGALADPNAVFEVDYRLLAERLAGIPDEVNDILRLCDGVRTIMKVVEDCAIPDVEALTALIRLRDENIIYDVSAVRVPDRDTGSSRLDGWLGSGPSPFPSGPPSDGTTGRIGMGSGPVEQSFAQRLEVEARGQMPPDASREASREARETREISETRSTTEIRATTETGERHDAQHPGGVPRRQTAPGLGLPSIDPPQLTHEPRAEASRKPEATPEPRITQQRRHDQVDEQVEPIEPVNVINFPAPGGSRTATPGPASLTLVSSPPVVIEPEPPALLTDTYRGLGPRPSLEVPRGGGRVQVDSSENETEQIPRARARPAPVATTVSSLPFDKPPEGEKRPADNHDDAAPRREVAEEAGEGTVRISFPDDEINRHDALDELGLPSRWRGMRILAGVLALGALAAVAAYRFKERGRTRGETEAESRIAATSSGPPVNQRPVVVPSPAPAPVPSVLPPSPSAAIGTVGGEGIAAEAPALPHVDLPKPVEPVPGSPVPPPRDHIVAAADGTTPPAASPRTAGGTTAATSEPRSPQPTAAPPSVSVTAARPPQPTGVPPSVAVTAARPHAGDEPLAEPSPPVPPTTKLATSSPPPAAPARATGSLSSPPVPPSTRVPPPIPPGRAATDHAPAERSPDFSRLLSDCHAAFSRNRMRDALAACGAAVQTNPNSADALTMLAHTELNLGRLARANELAAKAVILDPNLADAYVIIGGVNQDSGKNHEAKAAYRRYLQLAPQGRYADELRSIVNSL